MSGIVLRCVVLFCLVEKCALLYCFIALYCIAQCCIVWCCIVLYCIVQYVVKPVLLTTHLTLLRGRAVNYVTDTCCLIVNDKLCGMIVHDIAKSCI